MTTFKLTCNENGTFIRRNQTVIGTVEQRHHGTEVRLFLDGTTAYSTAVSMPRDRYTLSSDAGQALFFRDVADVLAAQVGQ